jgi:hypothetical protein
MIQIVDVGLSECHITKELRVPIPSPEPCSNLAGIDAIVPPFVAARSTLPLFPVVDLVVGGICGKYRQGLSCRVDP